MHLDEIYKFCLKYISTYLVAPQKTLSREMFVYLCSVCSYVLILFDGPDMYLTHMQKSAFCLSYIFGHKTISDIFVEKAI